ncbi:MAG TPA: CAP domain-containing protein [Patescibacteria group bacterium]|nr:CAP domain-containing protein [Patescibacteria group bacterium]
MEKTPVISTKNEPHFGLLGRRSFVILLAAFLLVKLLISLFEPHRELSQASDLTVSAISNAVNSQRVLHNLNSLTANPLLAKAAASKAQDMIDRNYFAHVDPDGHYIWDTIVADGYTPYLMLGENLAINFYDTDSLISAWMNSPTHRENILQAGFRDQGMGLSFGNQAAGQYYSSIANTFGTLASSAKSKSSAAAPAAKSDTPAPLPQPAPVATPSPATPAPPVPAASGSGQAAPAAGDNNSSTPLDIRGNAAALAQNTEDSFALPGGPSQPASTAPAAAPTAPATTASSAAAVVGSIKSTWFNDYQTNRYLILVSGVALLLLMLSDIKVAIEKKFGHLDKKINNLLLLLIALIVIAFMYWL